MARLTVPLLDMHSVMFSILCSVMQEGDSSGSMCYVTQVLPFAIGDFHM